MMISSYIDTLAVVILLLITPLIVRWFLWRSRERSSAQLLWRLKERLAQLAFEFEDELRRIETLARERSLRNRPLEDEFAKIVETLARERFLAREFRTIETPGRERSLRKPSLEDEFRKILEILARERFLAGELRKTLERLAREESLELEFGRTLEILAGAGFFEDEFRKTEDAFRKTLDEILARARPVVGWLFRGLYAAYALLVAAGVAVFYLSSLSPSVQVWRIQRNLAQAGITQPVEIEMSGGDAILNGQVATRRVSLAVSRRVAEIVGPAHVTNRLRVEEPEILGSDSELLGEAEVAMDTAYDDSQHSLQVIEAILDLPQFDTIRVRRGWTLIWLIRRRYGISRSKLPKSFAMLAEKISRLNDLKRPQDLRPGIRKIPILPMRHAASISPQVHPGFVDFVSSGLSGVLQQVAVRGSLGPIGSSRVLLTIPFTRGTAVQTQRIASLLPFSVLSSGMRIEFGGGASSNDALHQVLTLDEKEAISKALGQEKKREATVFILDAGWPNEKAYKSSLDALRGLVDQAREFYALNQPPYAVKWDDPPPKFSDLSTDGPPQHCVAIMHALQEFTDLDGKQVVKVVYVPLSLKQNSYQILSELLKLYWIAKKSPYDGKLSPERKAKLWKDAQDFATGVLDNLKKGPDMPDAPASPHPDEPYLDTWETDSSIAAAIWYLADLASYRDRAHQVYFLNESWTVLPDRVHLEAPEKSYGIIVAAAGDAPGVEVNGSPGLEFARLARPANIVLAALDAKQDADEPGCGSSKIVEKDIDNTMAAGFDGTVTGDGTATSGVCGTSFSAPRIAWLLALSEAIRKDDKKKEEWAESVQEKLKAARAAGLVGQWKKLYLHPKSILP